MKHWDQHLASVGTGTFAAAVQGFSFIAVMQGICIGVGVWTVTAALKWVAAQLKGTGQ